MDPLREDLRRQLREAEARRMRRDRVAWRGFVVGLVLGLLLGVGGAHCGDRVARATSCLSR